MKTCTKCHVEKELTEFKKVPRGKYGVHSICRACINKNAKDLRDGYVRAVKDDTGMIAPPVKRPFNLKIGDEVIFLKQWESNKEIGKGIIESISKSVYVIFTGKYRASFRIEDYCLGFKTVSKVREG